MKPGPGFRSTRLQRLSNSGFARRRTTH